MQVVARNALAVPFASRLLAVAFAALALAGLPGCSRQAAMDAIVDRAVDAEARADLDRITRGDPTLDAHLAPELRTTEAHAKVAELSRHLQGPANDRHLVGYEARTFNGDTRYDLTYELHRGDAQYPWLLQGIRLHRTSEGLLVEGVNVTPLARSLEDINAFTLAGRPAWMLAFLAAMVLVPVFIVATLVACARMRGLRRKWAWLLFIAFGMPGATLNWSTGAVALQFAVHLLGAGFLAPGVAGPWLLTLAFPLGAVVFWIRRRALLDGPVAPPDAVEAAATAGPAAS